MPILCLEGASAVGKTATASALAADNDAYVVPEVNALFERPADETPSWYFELQADRWTRAVEAARRHPLVVLDGDPFQPLWYNWAYDFEGWQGLDFMEAFYRPRLVQGSMRFPDRYVVLEAGEQVLRTRKEADRTRQRCGFEKHLRFVLPQRRYFEAMRAFWPEQVQFVRADSVGETVRALWKEVPRAQPGRRPVALFDYMIAWLRQHPAASIR